MKASPLGLLVDEFTAINTLYLNLNLNINSLEIIKVEVVVVTLIRLINSVVTGQAPFIHSKIQPNGPPDYAT